MRPLHVGDHGVDVRNLQTALNDRSRARGLPLISVDGQYGATTDRTVARISRVLGVLESTIKKSGATVGEQRIIRHPTTRTPAQLRRARQRAFAAPVTPTQIIGRETWGARPPRQGYAGIGVIRRRVVHHTAALAAAYRSPVLERLHMRVIQGWHFARGFSDIGYHRVTFPSGRTYAGRPLSALGAGVAGHNTGSVHYCLAGNFEVEQPTDAAVQGARRVMVQDGTSGKALYGHYQLQSNLCPGRNMKKRLNELR